MCKVLADLLGIADPLFSIGVHQLEQASGQPNLDVKLYSEIIRKGHQKTREVGLDPKDTTGEELYLALIELVKKHDAFLAKRLGADDPADVHDVLPRIRSFVRKLDMPKSVWAIKPAAAKRLVKLTPPKRVMKQLGYRSVDSMLKRESIAELFVAMRFVETEEWLQAFTKKYKHLSPSDFETRDIQFINLEGQRWGTASESFARRQHHNLTHMKEMGVIAILPMPVNRMPGITIAVLPLLLHYVNEIRLYSSYFKMQQVSPDFGETIVKTLIYDPRNHATVAGHDVHWRAVHRHFGRLDTKDHPEIFEPHVYPEDLHWRKAEEILYRIEPALHFWYEMDYVAVKTKDSIVSFNLMDAAVNYVNGLPYGRHVIGHFRTSLWNELFTRYIGEPALEYQVIKQLSPETPETNLEEKMLEEMFL